MEFILIARKLQEKYSTPESVETLFSGKALSALGKTDAEFETEYCRQNPLSFSCSEDRVLGWFVDSLFFYDSDNVWYFIVAGY